ADGQTLGGVLVVAVEAPIDKRAIAHGKQRSIPADDYDSCSFQPSSGIWQPVWLEPRPATFLAQVRLVSFEGLDGLRARVRVEGPAAAGARLELTVEGVSPGGVLEVGAEGTVEVELPIPDARAWSPQDPHLYRVLARLASDDGLDEVACTAGLRRIEVVGDELHLNGRRCYLRGVLDQGYWPASGLSAPSPEALRRDLELAREAGYNLVRKHLKLEDPRWLALADRLGMLVWEEPPSTSRYSPDSLAAFRQGIEQMVDRDANHPCVVVWGCFNEEWGLDWNVAGRPELQEAVAGTVELVRSLDATRPVVDNSGWSHVGGDLADWHYYEPDLGRWAKNVAALVENEGGEIPVPLHPPALEMKPLEAVRGAVLGRPNLNSEYGMGLTSVERGWQLKWQTQELRRHDRLSGYVYTELYDIEHELAGLLHDDRSPKDLANLSPAEVNADTVLVLDVLPVQPGIDLEVTGSLVSVEVRGSHHGAGTVSGRVRHCWGPHLGGAPPREGAAGSEAPELVAEPFVLGPPVRIETTLPQGWSAGRLHLWLEQADRVLASTELDVVRTSGSRP
ncbi:MAG: glycosyl hydrolase family 2, partial [Acidimicrobiaceae bacterium]|nr:glycosyl hydrolase family 2 [Acidimicrobiaceae bacterium]